MDKGSSKVRASDCRIQIQGVGLQDWDVLVKFLGFLFLQFCHRIRRASGSRIWKVGVLASGVKLPFFRSRHLRSWIESITANSNYPLMAPLFGLLFNHILTCAQNPLLAVQAPRLFMSRS